MRTFLKWASFSALALLVSMVLTGIKIAIFGTNHLWINILFGAPFGIYIGAYGIDQWSAWFDKKFPKKV